MLRKFITVFAAAGSLALTFTSPASAASLPDRMYGCARGDICMYSTEVISAATKIGIGRGEDWSSTGSSPYSNVRSVFNYGYPDTEDHVAVTYGIPGDQFTHTICVHRAEDGNLAMGHEILASMPAKVYRINWIHRSKAPCNE